MRVENDRIEIVSFSGLDLSVTIEGIKTTEYQIAVTEIVELMIFKGVALGIR